MQEIKKNPFFDLGQLVATPGALTAHKKTEQNPMEFRSRHITGDWGDVSAEDGKSNDEALELGNHVLSAYTLPSGTRIWIITEADRSSTTILLPEEY